MDRHAWCLAALIGLLLLPTTTQADYVGLEQMLDGTGAILQWDSARGVGALWREEQVVSFRPGIDWGLHNFKERVPLGDIKYQDGQILFSAEVVQRLESLLVPAPFVRSGRIITTIFIDPGHGGRDPGATGRHQVDGVTVVVKEKEVVLKAAQFLQQMLLRRFPDKQIILSRDKDAYIALEQRTELANSLPEQIDETILFISLHANASFRKAAQGFRSLVSPPHPSAAGSDKCPTGWGRRSLGAEHSQQHERRGIYHRERVARAQSGGGDAGAGRFAVTQSGH